MFAECVLLRPCDVTYILFSFIFKFFQEAYRENVKTKETEEKNRRMKEAKEKAAREKAERATRKKALIDITDQMQEGVLDSLLSAMQSGTAFPIKQRSKKPTNPPSNRGERSKCI